MLIPLLLLSLLLFLDDSICLFGLELSSIAHRSYDQNKALLSAPPQLLYHVPLSLCEVCVTSALLSGSLLCSCKWFRPPPACSEKCVLRCLLFMVCYL